MLILLIFILSSFYIMRSCHSFEIAAKFLGRHMPPGTRGATINAVGSSMPELIATIFFLFLYADLDGFSSGVATCAGSAVFNMIIIPLCCFIAVFFWGVAQKDGSYKRILKIPLKHHTLLRDGFFLLLAQIVLIYVLTQTNVTFFMSVLLILSYIGYIAYLLRGYILHRKDLIKLELNGENGGDDEEDEEDEEDICPSQPWWKSLILCDFYPLLYKGKDLTTSRAWIILGLSVFVMGVACYYLTEIVYDISDGLGIAPYFTAVVIAAAATSIPDTILSIRDSVNGHFEDAFSNAFGSNIFNITVGFGLPLLFYTLINGPVELAVDASSDTPGILALQIFILFLTVLTFVVFGFGKNIGKRKMMIIFGIYMLWVLFIIAAAFQVSWLSPLFSWVNYF